jgi:hypothetical protein
MLVASDETRAVGFDRRHAITTAIAARLTVGAAPLKGGWVS